METIFRDQRDFYEGDFERLSPKVSNANATAMWLAENPALADMKKAALLEALSRKNKAVLERLLARIFKEEKRIALEKLLQVEAE